MKIKPDTYLKNLTCLYVEDDPMVKESFLFIINKIFKKVYTANNGFEGLELYKKHSPDIILSDIKMPEMDGLEFAKQVKTMNKNSYIILITAFTDMEYIKKAIDLGVEGYITKPVDKKKLYKKLNFLANIIKHKKESTENLIFLKKIIEDYPNPVLLTKYNEIKLKNNAFINEFGNFETLDDIEDSLDIDLYLDDKPQIVEIQNKKYQVSHEKIDNVNKIIKFISIEKQNDLTRILNKITCIITIKTNDQMENIKKTIQENLRKDDLLLVNKNGFTIIPDKVDSKTIVEKIAKNIEEKLNEYKEKIKISTECKKISDLKELSL